MHDFEIAERDPHTRRAFLTRMTMAGLGVAAAALFTTAPADARGYRVLDISRAPNNANMPGIPGKTKSMQVLQYALTLEILEADLYRQALNISAGKTIDTPLPDDTSSYTLSIDAGGLPADKAALGFKYLSDFAAVEAAHRDFLRMAIQAAGETPVSPNPKGYTAPFGSNLMSVLTVIRTLEETGVRAYLGAAQFIKHLELTQVAAAIYSTEARHSAAINYILGMDTGPAKQPDDNQAIVHQHHTNDFEYFLTPEQVVIAVKPFFVH